MTEENLKVAVRVRPFNQREIDAKSILIVSMSGNQTVVKNPKTEEEKKFAYDYSYWSHDGFKTEADGYLSPISPKYADQKQVFNDLGVGVLANAWQGYNASLFAYGQTGSGKSYSVVGYGKNKGIVPMVCKDIFTKAQTIGNGITVEVYFSMCEIYSENVRDLLVKEVAAGKRTTLEVHQDPKSGFYAQGLKKCVVGSYDEIKKLMKEGSTNRTIASTNMNATSSRAHTIVTIEILQKYKNDVGKEMTKGSKINLVDLAGSERQDQTGATGDRLKEGAAINLSLTSLGNVISALADQAAGKSNIKVPYRDSVLTKLLMNALGGNCKTIMIAAISPADINFDESVSTLRYADRAKQIKTRAIINEDPTEKLIQSLKEENARLKKLLETSVASSQKLMPAAHGDSGGVVEDDASLKRQLEENNKAMEDMKLSYEEKLKKAQEDNSNLASSKIMKKSKTVPHLRNVNMDSMLSGTIRHLLDGEGMKKIGSDPNSDIILGGINIMPQHATITIKNQKFILEKCGDSKVLRNGRLLNAPAELNHRDRLLFGASQYYIFADPSKVKPNEPYWLFESMQDEIALASGIIPTDTRNMTQEEIQCQSELVDLIPAIDEANFISVALDKKVLFSAFPVSAEARGDVDGKFQAYVSVKDYTTHYEWFWPKQRFLDRKADFTGIYNDFMDDGIINTERYMHYDPFYESPDVDFQIGTVIIYPKGAAYIISNSGEYKVISLKSKEVGTMFVEILPCNASGRVVNPNDGLKIEKPEVELVNFPVSFIFNIKTLKIMDPMYEDIHCEFKIFNDTTVYKTNSIKRVSDKFDINFSKQFSFTATPEFLDYLLKKQIYVKIFAKQKHVKAEPNLLKISTKDFYDRERAQNGDVMIQGKDVLNNTVDPEKQRLADDLRISMAKTEQIEFMLNGFRRLISVNEGAETVNIKALKSVLLASNEIELRKLLEANKYANASDDGLKDESFNLRSFNMKLRQESRNDKQIQFQAEKTKSKACVLQ